MGHRYNLVIRVTSHQELPNCIVEGNSWMNCQNVGNTENLARILHSKIVLRMREGVAYFIGVHEQVRACSLLLALASVESLHTA